MTQFFLSEGYCYFIEHLHIAYYLSNNRIYSSTIGSRFPSIQRLQTFRLGETEAREMTGLGVFQLRLMLIY